MMKIKKVRQHKVIKTWKDVEWLGEQIKESKYDILNLAYTIELKEKEYDSLVELVLTDGDYKTVLKSAKLSFAITEFTYVTNGGVKFIIKRI